MNKDRVKKFVTDNGTAIVGSIFMAGLSFVAIKYNIPIFGSGVSGGSSNFVTRTKEVYIPRNSVETAINAVYESAKTYSFSSNKVAAAKDILKIVKKQENVDDGTKMFAIKLMNELAKQCSFASNKDEISKLILEI